MNKEPLTKERVTEIRKIFNENFPPSYIVSEDGELFEYRVDIHKEKTEKFVSELCQYLAHIKGYRYWDVKKRSVWE